MPAVGSSSSITFGVLHDQQAKLEPLGLAMAEIGGEPIPACSVRPISSSTSSTSCSRFSWKPKRRLASTPRIAAARDFEIAANGQVLEHARNLEFASDPGARDLVLFPVGDVGVVQEHPPFGAFGLAGDQVHQGRLAGAVGAEQNAQLTFLDRSSTRR